MLGEAFDDVIVAARAGAGWAYTRLYHDLAGTVVAYLRRQGARDAEDVASETFLSVFRSIEGFEGDEQGFRSWVFTIAHRRLVDERRRRGRRVATTRLEAAGDPVASDGHADASVVAAAEHDAVAAHLAALTEPQRDVVLLRVVAGLSVAETAVAVARSEQAVRQLQRRGLRTLQRRVEAQTRGGGDGVQQSSSVRGHDRSEGPRR